MIPVAIIIRRPLLAVERRSELVIVCCYFLLVFRPEWKSKKIIRSFRMGLHFVIKAFWVQLGVPRLGFAFERCVFGLGPGGVQNPPKLGWDTFRRALTQL